MFGFRKIAYTILSRKFWLGFVVGFFCASLFYVQSASAQQIPFDSKTVSSALAVSVLSITSTSWNNYMHAFTGTSTITLKHRNDTYNNTVSAIGYLFSTTTDLTSGGILSVTYNSYVENGRCRFSTGVYNTSQKNLARQSDTTFIIGGQMSTTTNLSFPSQSNKGVGFFLTTGNTLNSHRCQIDITSVKWNGNEMLTFSSVSVSSSQTIPLAFPIQNDIIKNMQISSLLCSVTSTSSSCVPTYATSTILFTPEMLFYTSVWFVLCFFGAFWLTKSFL